MKNLISILLAMTTIATMAVSAVAAVESENVDPKVETCCGRFPNWQYELTKEKHLVRPDGLCVQIKYYGDKICGNCDSLWERDVHYKTANGCGSFHDKTASWDVYVNDEILDVDIIIDEYTEPN